MVVAVGPGDVGVAADVLVGVGVLAGARVGALVGAGAAVAAGPRCGIVGSPVVSGSESSHATAATISRTNSPPMMPRVETPIRCLNPNPYRCEPSPLI